MTDGLKPIGQHTFEPPTRGGMRGGIALTVIRDVPVDELLLRLKARPNEMSDPVAYRDVSLNADVAHLTPCMYWAYVLEHGDSARGTSGGSKKRVR